MPSAERPVWRARENGATSGLGIIAAFDYDYLGRRTSLTRGNGTVTAYAYDSASRLQTLSHDLSGTARDLTLGFTYNPAGQIATSTRSNTFYSVPIPAAATTDSTANGLNQLSLHGGAAPTYDARGNLTGEGGRTFSFSSETLLTYAAANTRTQTYTYDPLLRYTFEVTTGGGLPRSYAYDGDDMILVNLNGNLLVRYVYGPGENEILYHYDRSGVGRGRRRLMPISGRSQPILRPIS
jgi:YD repeat-containing protein